MPKKKLPPDVIDHWPEVFNDIDIDVIPINYLDSIIVTFNDGKVWDIDIQKSKQKTDEIEEAIEDLLDHYSDVISAIDFRLNTEKVKQDITNRTRFFMKKRK